MPGKALRISARYIIKLRALEPEGVRILHVCSLMVVLATYNQAFV